MDEKMNNLNISGEGFQELSAEDLSGVWGGSLSFCPLCEGRGMVSGRKCPMCLGGKVVVTKERLRRSRNEY